MSYSTIKLTVTPEARKKGQIVLAIFTTLGITLLIVAGILHSQGEEQTSYIFLGIGFMSIFMGLIVNLIILSISDSKIARSEGRFTRKKDEMPKGAKIFIVIMLVAFLIFLIVISTI